MKQLLFLEIFELPYKIEGNLGNKASGILVNSLNSESRPALTVGELPLSSRRARGHLRLHAGMGRLLRVVSVFLGRVIKLRRRRRCSSSSPLFFPSSPLSSVELVQSP